MRKNSRFARRQGKIFGEFGKDVCPGYDYSDEALQAFFELESYGNKENIKPDNGYVLGKTWFGSTVDGWETEIRNGRLHLSELEEDFKDDLWCLKDIQTRIANWEREQYKKGESFSWGRLIEPLYNNDFQYLPANWREQ